MDILNVDNDVDYSADLTSFPNMDAFPVIGGIRPLSAQLFGKLWAQRCNNEKAFAYGPGFDLSGNGNHISQFLEAAPGMGDYGINGAVMSPSGTPTIPITVDELMAIGNGGFTIIAFADVAAAGKTIALARSGTVDPFSSLLIAPSSLDARAQVSSGGSAVSAQIGTLTGELDNTSLYAGVYTNALRTVYSKVGVAATKSATEATAKVLSGAVPFEIMDEAGAQVGTNVGRGLAIYPAPFTQTQVEFGHTAFRTFVIACGSPFGV